MRAVAFIIGSGKIQVSPKEAPRFPDGSVEATNAWLLRIEGYKSLIWGSRKEVEALGVVNGGLGMRMAFRGGRPLHVTL